MQPAPTRAKPARPVAFPLPSGWVPSPKRRPMWRIARPVHVPVFHRAEDPDHPRRVLLEDVPLGSGRAISGIALLLVLFLVVFAPAAVLFFDQIMGTETLPEVDSVTEAGVWAQIVFSVLLLGFLPVAYLSLVRPGRPLLDQLGLRPTRRTPVDLAIGFGLAIVLLVLLALVAYAFEAAGATLEESELTKSLLDLMRRHPEFVILLPLAAAFTEEIAFRGLLQPRVGILASAALFGLVHSSYGTALQIVAPFALGLVFGVVYWWRPTLWIVISAHFFFDLITALTVFLPESAS